ncbi:hypothetical protein HOF92_15165, partial [bacterium]|nr:hypothetical protein [bacterium]
LKNTDFFKQVLGANFVKDKSEVKSISNENLSFELDGEDSANNQKWPDVISLNENSPSAEILFSYEGGGPAIISNIFGTGKAAYLAFGFEGINGVDNRNAVMAELLAAVGATASEVLDRMEWAFHSNPHAYKAMIRNFEITNENRQEVEAYLEGKVDKAPYRTILQALMK